MERIDVIKKRFARYKNIDKWRGDINEYYKNKTEADEANRDFELNVKDDLEYALSLIETQKKALKQLPLELNKLVHEDGDTLVWSDVEAFLHEYIQESLKQE